MEYAFQTYTGPEAQLLSFGEPRGFRELDLWPDYAALGITAADTPGLIAMATDAQLSEIASSNPAVWAPLHAWRALAQLGAVEAAAPLAELIAQHPIDDWVSEELPEVYALLGPEALPPLSDVAFNRTVDVMARVTAFMAITRVGQRHADAAEDCKRVLRDQLAQYAEESDVLNAFVINGLADLKAVEHVELIRAAFEAEKIDLSVMGDVEDVEIELGLRAQRATARRPTRLSEMFQSRERPKVESRRERKVGRNEPCPCGSGRKYKRCCGQT